MRRVFPFVSLFLLLGSVAFSQNETLFGSTVEHGGFGGPAIRLTPIRGELGALVGGYGGWLIGHQFMIGGGGYGLVSNIRADAAAEQRYATNLRPLYIEFGYGGIVLEYSMMPSRIVHFTFATLLGAGGATYREKWYDNWDFDTRGYNRIDHNEVLFVAEPQVNVELNMTEWFRMTLGGSYRFVNGLNDLTGLTNKDLSGPAGSLTLRFGCF